MNSSLTKSQLQTLCLSVQRIALEAGAVTKIFFQQKNFTTEQKSDKSPVTSADLAAHHIIEKGLSDLTPSFPVLSEEGLTVLKYKTDIFWCVDPIDGTKEFVQGIDEFTVNIALIENGVSILGVIHVPMKDCLYFAVKELGAFKQENSKPAASIRTRRRPDRLSVLISRFHNQLSKEKLAVSYPNADLTPVGSTYKFCLIAEGVADLHVRKGRSSFWDTAAAHCILEEAGGFMLQSDGTPLVYLLSQPDVLNPNFTAVGDKELIPQALKILGQESIRS